LQLLATGYELVSTICDTDGVAEQVSCFVLPAFVLSPSIITHMQDVYTVFLNAIREVIATSNDDQKHVDRGVKALVTIFRHLDRWFTSSGGSDGLRRTTSGEARKFHPGQTLKEAAARLQKEPNWTPSFLSANTPAPKPKPAPAEGEGLSRTSSLEGLQRTVSANTAANLGELAAFLDEQAATWERGEKPGMQAISIGHTMVYRICAESGTELVRLHRTPPPLLCDASPHLVSPQGARRTRSTKHTRCTSTTSVGQ